MPRLIIERRFKTPFILSIVFPLLSIVLALLTSSLLLLALNVSPLGALKGMINGALGSWYGISEVLVKAIPLVICGIAVALAFTMKVWNIGAEGQIYLGALASAAAVRYFPVENTFFMLSVMAVMAILAGAFWGGIAGYLKGRWNVNEIITTLMLNYVAIHLVDYFVYGPWRDPSSLGFPMTAPFPDFARLPTFGGTRVHAWIFLALIIVILYRVVIRWTRWGFEIRAIGENQRAALYAGIPYIKNVVLVMAVSGALSALAGMGEIAGLQGRLQHGFSPGYGYTAIIVAWLARLNPWGTVLVSIFMGIIMVGGETLQVIMRLPLASVQVIQGLILLFVLASEFFRNYKIRILSGDGR